MARRIETTPERIRANLERVRGGIAHAAEKAGRTSESVKLIAVTKYVDAGAVRALLRCGVRELGENRCQDARAKIEELARDTAQAGARWHFIGHLQTNKVKFVVRTCATIDAVDSLRLLERIGREAEQAGKAPYPCLAEVNVSGEAQKYGLAPAEVEAFLNEASKISTCTILGLMTMAPLSSVPEKTSRPVFAGLREILERANRKGWYRLPLHELSMGMTRDYPLAVEEGATMTRVGSALFE